MKLYMFRTVPLSIIRSFSLTHSNGICHTGLLTACEQDQHGTSSFVTLTYRIDTIDSPDDEHMVARNM